MGAGRFAACRPVVDALADEPVEAVDRDTAPRDAGGKDHGSRADDIVAIEVNLPRFRIEAGNGARDQNLRAEAPCLIECAAREFVAGNPTGKAEIVFDA